MPTLLLRMRAPMMSWGDHSRFTNRDTRREPTKSAVIGLLCAALGRPRWEPVEDLTALKMGVRVNQEGTVQCDYHTIMDSIRPNGKKVKTELSWRYYVADADYLVGLEGNHLLLETLDTALQSPTWQLYFGRKSFVPSCPIQVGIVEQPLLAALEQPIHRKRTFTREQPDRLRCVVEVPDSLDVRQDVPLDWQKRLFGRRCVDTHFINTELCISQN
ncbi:type I-E CRISPR-associated protein Cas5/CasD [Romeria aff. gracilis LEGE 07310]|uniref:Type I-E CRISPR-associated protein Cas5/CasD n=1 Tax=Vasconcelosia minhoensis LEGE 07310 TaxID=915328 RepID=A0A8J7A8H6_9CYAN|nr:type I-E CRISPR-associated protein Cas5/CasD [Romeria gracilis]MBE9077995.1 type I-E CRISPR-associated protein Cas5/CasD [Romeria aff. gracilis LEGE 07310]